MTPSFTGVVAMDESRAIGFCGGIPWHLPADLRLFRQRTMGHPVLMGRHTFESLGHPLPGRQNIVLSRSTTYRAEGAVVIREPLELASLDLMHPEVMVIGGAQVYTLLLPHISTLYVSLVPGEHEADTFFPEFRHLFSEVSEPVPYDGFELYTYFR